MNCANQSRQVLLAPGGPADSSKADSVVRRVAKSNGTASLLRALRSRWPHTCLVLVALFILSGQLAHAEFREPACPSPGIILWAHGGVEDSTYSTTCLPNGEPPVFGGYYSTSSQWFGIVASNCNGSYWGNSVSWLGIHQCSSNPNDFTVCMDAELTVPPPPTFEPNWAGGHYPTCYSGKNFFLLFNPPPPTEPSCQKCGDPMNPANGNEYLTETDYLNRPGFYRRLAASL